MSGQTSLNVLVEYGKVKDAQAIYSHLAPDQSAAFDSELENIRNLALEVERTNMITRGPLILH